VNYNWNWSAIFKAPYVEWLLSGFATTCLIAICAWCIALVLGTSIAVARTSNSRFLRLIGTTYVEIFRNIPVLVQIFIWFFVVPELLPTSWGMYLKRGLPQPQLWTAIVALGVYTAAKVAEQLRSGIQTSGSGPRNAAMALGLTSFQVYRYVLLPKAYRVALPALTSEFMGVFKNSSLALTIGVLELTAQANQISEYTFQSLEAFLCATALYVTVTLVVVGGMTYLEKRMKVVGTVSAYA
jgi:glutamate/aspartate transport system permease protein